MTDPIPVKGEVYDTETGNRLVIDAADEHRVEYHFVLHRITANTDWIGQRDISTRLFRGLIKNGGFTKVEKS